MRKAIWLLTGLFALFTMSATPVLATETCTPLGANGKLNLEEEFDGCDILIKVSSNIPGAEACVSVYDTTVRVVVDGCSLSTTLLTDAKTECKNGTTNTKIEIKFQCDEDD